MDKRRIDVIKQNEISQLYAFRLGSFEQKVLIEGRKADLPIVLSLHGGPGTPIPFSVGCRGMFPEFTNKYIMVYWDQYGCGINNARIDNTFTIDMFVDMANDLVREIKQLYPNNKLYIFATSWGSILSAKLIEKPDSLVDGVVVWGQIIKNIFYNKEVYSELENNKNCRKFLENIKNIDINCITGKDLKLISNYIRKYTNGYNNKNGKKTPMGNIIKGLITSPDYKFKDFKAIMVNGYMNNISLWKEILQIDLSIALSNVDIPYIMIQGSTDIVASTKTVRELVHNQSSTNLSYVIVDNAGHYPSAEGMDSVLKQLTALTK